jgi:hypothetical protein
MFVVVVVAVTDTVGMVKTAVRMTVAGGKGVRAVGHTLTPLDSVGMEIDYKMMNEPGFGTDTRYHP